MAPTVLHALGASLTANTLQRRVTYTCPSGYHYSDGYCYSSWYFWGRWVVLGISVLFGLLAILAICTRRSRMARRRGQQATYGTGWMGGNVNPQPQFNNPNAYAAPPPQYSQATAPYPGQSYYATGAPPPQAGDVPLQQPATAYQPTRGAETEEYAPPAGPPPGVKN